MLLLQVFTSFMTFVKGQSGNPNGRPPGTFSITELVRKKLQECPEGEDKKTYAQVFIDKLFQKANKQGDHPTMKLIWNYMDGLPQGSLDLTSNGKELFPQPIVDVSENHSHLKDHGTQPKDTGDSRGDVSIQDSVNPALPDSTGTS